MSGFFKNVVGGIRGIVDVATANINPYRVQTGKREDYSSLAIKLQDGNLVLYRRQASYECVLVNSASSTKVYSLFRLTNEDDAFAQFRKLSQILNTLLQCSSSVFQEQILQKICDISREHQSWTTAHVAAYVGLYECFKHQTVFSFLNTPSFVSYTTPLMTAVQGKQQLCIQELLKCGAKLDMEDVDGNTVYHHAVLLFPDAIPLFVPYDRQKVIDHPNKQGKTALSIACEKGLAESVEKLLQGGANPNVSTCESLPIHLAVKASSIKCVELLCEKHVDQVLVRDGKYGASAVHWARTRQMVEALGRLGSDVNMRSNTGHTPLHIMMEKSRLDCVMELLCYGADTRVMDNQGNTPLHLAVKNDDADMVKTLVVFGADINLCNAQKHSARHLAATSNGKNKDVILFMLHMSGAARCLYNVKGCLNGCSYEGNHNGTKDPTMIMMMEADKDAILDEMLASLPGGKMTKAQEAGLDSTDSAVEQGDRVLCLDGGGIRGLVLIQMLMAIQDEAGFPIKDCFDWIGGTSTGGLLALGIVCDKSLTYMKGLYFRMKDEVFTGSRPYNSAPFEVMLKREFGESQTMTDIKEPKVFVTGVFGDRYPTDLHLFRNYHTTIQRDFSADDKGSKFKAPQQPEDQLIWQAARCSGAAPTYFRSAGRFIDGGLMANNPTLDMLTEIHEYNTGLKLRNQGHKVRKIACVVSLGTGRVPVVPNQHIDVYRPEGILDVHRVAKGVTGLLSTLIDQATVSEGRPVDRARAWCSMLDIPFTRFSPRLSEDVPLDCHDNKCLMKMMWETQCYLVSNKHRIKHIAEILKRNYHPRNTEFSINAKI